MNTKDVPQTETDDQFRIVAETARDYAIFALDPAGNVVSWSAGAERLKGYTAEEIIGQHFSCFYAEEDRKKEKPQKSLENASSTEDRWEDEEWQVRKDGSKFWAKVVIAALRGHSGQLIGFAKVSHDLTQLKRAEAGQATSHLLIEAVKDYAIFMLDPAGNVVSWNAGAERIKGYTFEEIIGQHFSRFYTQKDRQQGMPQRVLEVAAQSGRCESEGWRVRKDGLKFWANAVITSMRDRSGTLFGFAKITRDLTQRKQTEDKLRASHEELERRVSERTAELQRVNEGLRVSEERLRTMIEALQLRDRAVRALSQGILITDPHKPDNPSIYASPSVEQITGYSENELIGRNCRFLQGKDSDPHAVAQIRSAIRERKPCEVELLNYRKDGTPFWNQLLISPVRDEEGRLTHFIGIMTDVSERRRLEMQFRQAQKMEAVGRLAGGVANDFNNLLTIINGYTGMLIHQLPAEDPKQEMIAEVHKAGERASSLTKQLLVFSRQSVQEPKVLDLNSIVAETEKMLHRLIGEDIQLTTLLAPGLFPVKADPGQLQQAFINLAVNARDAMPRGGKLTVETQDVELTEEQCWGIPDCRPGRYSLLAVTDTGTGMDETTKTRIFEPFFTTKEPGKGTGLGLAMVYGFVKSCGGHISVYSEPGHGTTFKVYLPQAQDRVLSPKSWYGAAKMPGGTETVLLVEDDDAVRALTRHVLQSGGYRVLEASNGKDALRLAEEHPGPIHMLVTDVVMPNMGGRQVAEQVTVIKPGIKVLFCSGYTDDAVVRNGVLEAGTAFMQKPFSAALLAQKVRDVLDDRP